MCVFCACMSAYAFDLNNHLAVRMALLSGAKLCFESWFAVRTKKLVSDRRKKTKTKTKKPWRPWRLLTLVAYQNHPFQLFLLKDLSLIFPLQISSALVKISLTDYLTEDFGYLPTLQHLLVMLIDFIVLLSTKEQGMKFLLAYPSDFRWFQSKAHLSSHAFVLSSSYHISFFA